MRGVRWVLLCGLLIGCGSEFKSEGEELSYLSSLANPTPEQWKRRNELVEKAQSETLHKASEERTARYNIEGSAHVKRWLEAAADHESRGEWKTAWLYYEDICTKYPDTEGASIATERRKVCLEKLSEVR